MSKNIVICCDGTGNEVGPNISNILKLYRVLRKTHKSLPDQTVYYDAGVGTLAKPDPWKKLQQDANAILQLATGYGLDDHVIAAYRFIVAQYQDGDELFLFGFSRGAHTVRVLAGLIHKVGLLRPEQVNLAEAAYAAYMQSPETPHIAIDAETEPSNAACEPTTFTSDDRASQFARVVSTRWPTIKFLGVWDTVASVIAPTPDRFYTFTLQTLPYTQRNPSVKAFRHAISIDERRRMFRLSPWDEGQIFMKNRFSKTNNVEPQDCRQVWFAGVHADIGGGYPEEESGLSKFPLLWMIDEAIQHGLAVDRRTINHLAWGKPRQGSPFSYVAPSIEGTLHNSLYGAWNILEWLPKSDRYKECPKRESHFGYYIPDGEPRMIPMNAFIHQSVLLRQADTKLNYNPTLPSAYQTIPMPVPDGSLSEPASV